jgi:hypothetical protein
LNIERIKSSFVVLEPDHLDGAGAARIIAALTPTAPAAIIIFFRAFEEKKRL